MRGRGSLWAEGLGSLCSPPALHSHSCRGGIALKYGAGRQSQGAGEQRTLNQGGRASDGDESNFSLLSDFTAAVFKSYRKMKSKNTY